MIDRLKAGVARLAAIGAVKRKGIGALRAYPGKVTGTGYVIRKETGERIDFVIEGDTAQQSQG